jgi:hypothetical protein
MNARSLSRICVRTDVAAGTPGYTLRCLRDSQCDAAGTGAMVASFGSNASTGATGACREQIRSGRETIGWVPCHRSCFLNVDVGYSRAPLSCGSQKAQLAHYQREAFAMVQRLLEVKQSDAQQQVSLCAGKAAVSASVLF